MRKLTVLALAVVLALPSLADAQWKPRKAKKAARPSSGYVVRDGRTVFTPAPPRPPSARPAPRVSHGSRVLVLGVDPLPFWLGWSWGWGYYPMWPRPYYEGAQPGQYPDDANRVRARVEAYGGGDANVAAGTLALSMEGPYAGFNADVTGLALTDVGGAASDGTLTVGGARATWTFASDAAFRARLEFGGAMLSVPSSDAWAGTSYANTMSFGPQVGVSGNLGLVGPFGLEAHARVMPWPVPVVDARLAMVVRGGPLAVSAGWRSVDVNGDGVDHPEAHFSGPEVGLQLGF